MSVMPILMLMQMGYAQKSIYSHAPKGRGQKSHANIWYDAEYILRHAES